MCSFVASGVRYYYLFFFFYPDWPNLASGTDIEVDPLDIDNILPVHETCASFNDGFDKLVLPSGHRDIVRALVQTHAQRQGSFFQREFDIVKGKGKGLVILLHGAPGMLTSQADLHIRSCYKSDNPKG